MIRIIEDVIDARNLFNRERQKNEPDTIRCPNCNGGILYYSNGDWYASSDYVEGAPYCRDCMIEYCMETDCNKCKYGPRDKCKFSYLKDYGEDNSYLDL